MPDDPVKVLLDKFHPEAKAEGGDAVTALLDRFHPVATAPADPRSEAVPLTYADGSAVEDTTPKPTLDDRIGTERTEASPVDYDEFRRDERDPMYAPERAKTAKNKQLAERGFASRWLHRSVDALAAATLAGGGRSEETTTGLGEMIGTLLGGSLPTETSNKRTREKVAEAGAPWSELIGYLERKDPGNIGIRPAETAGRLAVDLGTMALPGAAGVHGAKGFALGSVLSDPTHPAEAAVSGALAYAGMKGGAALLSKPIAAVAERAVSKMAPDTAKFLTRALTGVAEGAGMAAAPHVTEDGLHSALLGAIRGNPDDKISAATNILLVAAFRAYGREIPTPVAEAYLRGNFARVPATVRPLMDSIAGPIIRAGEEVRVEPAAVDTAPVEGVRPKRADTGAVNVEPVVEAAAAGAKGAARAVADTMGSFVGRIRNKGTPTAVEMAEKAEAQVDRAKEYKGTGERGIGAERDAAMAASGHSPATEAGKASVRLSTPRDAATTESGTKYGYSVLEEAVRGRTFDGKPVELGPEEAKIVDATRALVDKGGRMSEASKVKVYDETTGQHEPFKNIPGGRVFPHVMAPDMMDALIKGPASPLFRKIVDAYAHANELPREAVEADFMERHQAMVSGMPTAGEGPTQVEFKRKYRKFPSAIRDGGEWIDLFESNPYEYARRFADSRADRLAFIDVFGQDIPKPKPVSGGSTDVVMGGANPVDVDTTPTLASRFKQAQSEGWADDFSGLVRGLHGHAIREPILDPSSAAGKAARLGKEALKVVKALNLTTSAGTNAAEFTGNMSSTFGKAEAWNAMYEMARQSPGWKADRATVEQIGAVTRDVLNASYDPTHPIKSGIRIFGDVLRRFTAHGPVNESQEYATAVLSLRAARRFQAGGGKSIDIDRVESMGYSRDAAARLVAGKATQAEYDAFVRRAPGQLVGANLSPVEKSSIESNRIMRGATAFAHYSWMSARNAANNGLQFLRGINDAATNPSLSPSQRWGRAYNATRNMTGWVANKAIQGTLGSFILAWLTEGKEGAAIRWNEMKDRPFRYAFNSFLYSTFGGPILGPMARAAGGESVKNLDNAIYPWFALKEAVGVLKPSWGPDRYKGKDVLERMEEWWKRNTPIHRSVETFFAAVGLGSEQGKDIDTAKRAYYRWRYDTSRKGMGSYTPPDSEEANVYRANIRYAADAVAAGKPPEVVNAYVMKALGIDGKDGGKVADSIERRMILTDKDVEGRLPELKARIGEDAYAMLELHDELLDRLARSIRPRKAKPRRSTR